MPKVSRRQFVSTTAFAAGGFALGYATNSLILSQILPPTTPVPTTPDEALNNLMAGNARYMQGAPIHPNQSAERQAEVAQGQQPWAAILGCIDSRVPPELVFDQGLGDLYVARTAGQVIDNYVIGSLEYAFKTGAKLIMVLGHQSCGAVQSTIQVLQTNGSAPGQIAAIVEAIKPAVIAAQSQPGDLLENATTANVMLEVEYLKSSSQIISNALDDGSIKLVGAEYDLHTGAVNLIP
ncbi:MAG: carbonic anhydrase [Candidatus Bathyarchaeia archaeon]